MDLKTKISCLEDLCPADVQEMLSDKADAKLIADYASYKQAVSDYIHKKIRFGKTRGKLNAIGEAQSNDTEAPESAESDVSEADIMKGMET